jgi:hypothetical protein
MLLCGYQQGSTKGLAQGVLSSIPFLLRDSRDRDVVGGSSALSHGDPLSLLTIYRIISPRQRSWFLHFASHGTAGA